VAVWNVNISSTRGGLSDLSLANVEALAQTENPNCPNGCFDQVGDGCYCYYYFDNKKEATWPN
jgi:hypothetical protein